MPWQFFTQSSRGCLAALDWGSRIHKERNSDCPPQAQSRQQRMTESEANWFLEKTSFFARFWAKNHRFLRFSSKSFPNFPQSYIHKQLYYIEQYAAKLSHKDSLLKPAHIYTVIKVKNLIAEYIVQNGWLVLKKYITELTAINLFYRRSKSHPRWLELYSRHGLLLLLFRSIWTSWPHFYICLLKAEFFDWQSPTICVLYQAYLVHMRHPKPNHSRTKCRPHLDIFVR